VGVAHNAVLDRAPVETECRPTLSFRLVSWRARRLNGICGES
jgi:hypothetical protein